MAAQDKTKQEFSVVEASIDDIHAAYKAGRLTARAVVQAYLDRIEAYDRNGPKLNSVISLNPQALAEADRLDALTKQGQLSGPLHGIPLLLKDQIDVKGMPTTMGSILFKDFRPERDGFVVRKLKSAGAIILGKVTLGELGGGDTHGSLFGSTRNVYDPERTAGGSSGGCGVAVSANFCTAALGQEGFSSIRRPSIWNGIVGMRPSIGLVSRSGVFNGWPTLNGSVGPMAKSVADLARLMDCIVGFDQDDPSTAHGYGRTPESYHALLNKNGLAGARLGILREVVGYDSEPESADFKKVDEVFNRAVVELRQAGAEIIDPIVIPDLKALLAKRARSAEDDETMYQLYTAGTNPPFKTRADVAASPLFKQVVPGSQKRWLDAPSPERQLGDHRARSMLMTNLLKVMAEHRLDAIIHKAVEHQPTLIKDGVNPPFVDQKGAPHINTFLMSVPSIVVPAGYTSDDLPAGITFLGRPYSDDKMIQLAFAYEQATKHRRPPATTP
ncbi:amidase [Undibacter mobilis]|uniref:Amidase n=1 Tax=Undibacter mobilis TaxID=2292256 RepID=A0A371BAW1_9BRAD|nr:amidase family protein [Undibacter mobilis]RDV04710.1 amidase [Undibacter mobilis]